MATQFTKWQRNRLSLLSLKNLIPSIPCRSTAPTNNGATKIRGRIIDVGSLGSSDAVLEKYLLERDESQAGRNSLEKLKSDSVALDELCNRFLADFLEDKAGKAACRDFEILKQKSRTLRSMRLVVTLTRFLYNDPETIQTFLSQLLA